MTEKLSAEIRDTVLQPLLDTGWEMVEGRDGRSSAGELKAL